MKGTFFYASETVSGGILLNIIQAALFPSLQVAANLSPNPNAVSGIKFSINKCQMFENVLLVALTAPCDFCIAIRVDLSRLIKSAGSNGL